MNEVLNLMSDPAITGRLNDIGGHMGNYNWHMVDGPYMWFWMAMVWVFLIVIAFLVYRDAESRGMNGLLWFVLVILPWAGFVFLVIYLIARDDRHQYEMSQRSPEAILDERYARGEITGDEYRQMKECLHGGV